MKKLENLIIKWADDDSFFYGEIGTLFEECYIDYSEDQL